MRQRLIWLVLAVGAVVPALGSPVIAPNLGSASTFGLLGSTISNTGVSNVVGNVGAKTTITGFPPGTATGTVYPFPSDPTVAQAYLDFVNAFNLASALPSTQSLADLTMSRLFLGNNVFTFPSLTDVLTAPNITLTFDAQGDSTEVFIIEIARDLTVNGPLNFTLQNGALASNIFWIVGRTETINPVGVPETWEGSILAGTSFTMSSIGPSSALAGTVNGCVFAETANTLAGKTQVNGCGSSVPEPGSFGLVSLGGLLGILACRKFRPSAIARCPGGAWPSLAVVGKVEHTGIRDRDPCARRPQTIRLSRRPLLSSVAVPGSGTVPPVVASQPAESIGTLFVSIVTAPLPTKALPH